MLMFIHHLGVREKHKIGNLELSIKILSIWQTRPRTGTQDRTPTTMTKETQNENTRVFTQIGGHLKSKRGTYKTRHGRHELEEEIKERQTLVLPSSSTVDSNFLPESMRRSL